ncbi:hypothetical protein Tco_0674787 [Tanacetum coccineum]
MISLYIISSDSSLKPCNGMKHPPLLLEPLPLLLAPPQEPPLEQPLLLEPPLEPPLLLEALLLAGLPFLGIKGHFPLCVRVEAYVACDGIVLEPALVFEPYVACDGIMLEPDGIGDGGIMLEPDGVGGGRIVFELDGVGDGGIVFELDGVGGSGIMFELDGVAVGGDMLLDETS